MLEDWVFVLLILFTEVLFASTVYFLPPLDDNLGHQHVFVPF